MIVYVDVETTANGGPTGTSPEAHWKNNKVLLIGWAVDGEPVKVSDKLEDFWKDIEGTMCTFVGHNLKFDLKYLIRERGGDKAWWDQHMYADTMTSEYLQSGHVHKMWSLEKACAHYGIKYTKSLDLGALIKSGIKMEDIPREDLEPYLIDDVENLRTLSEYQDTQTTPHILPLAKMELVGMEVDIERTEAIMTDLVLKETAYSIWLKSYAMATLIHNNGLPVLMSDFDKAINPTAPRTVSYLLTGQPADGLKITKKRWARFDYSMEPILTKKQIDEIWPGETPTNLGYSMTAGKLGEVASLVPNDLTNYVLLYRHVQKLMGTYIGPFLESAAIQGAIYPSMNTAITSTGRLSSSNPNGQNCPEEARKCIKSRHGKLYELDFKQLEIVTLACVSKDKQLIADLNAGDDLHYLTGREVFGWKSEREMNPADRKVVKGVNFGLIYGGGVKGLAASTGQPMKLIQQLIKAFYTRYPGVAEWQKEFYTKVVDNMVPFGYKDGEQVYRSTVDCKGTLYTFDESKSPDWLAIKTGRKYSFKPTETKNYPVQGFAGGGIVMEALLYLNRYFNKEYNTDIIMTVHDSILIDTDMSRADIDLSVFSLYSFLKDWFDLPTKIEMDIKEGSHWR